VLQISGQTRKKGLDLSHAGLAFDILRHDPDKIMVGEISAIPKKPRKIAIQSAFDRAPGVHHGCMPNNCIPTW